MTGGDRLSGDHQRIAQGGDRLGDLSAQADGIAAELKSTVDGTGACWGDDEIGRSFAASHTAHAAEVLAGAGALPGRLADVGTRFVDAAAGMRRLDEQGVQVLRSAGESTR